MYWGNREQMNIFNGTISSSGSECSKSLLQWTVHLAITSSPKYDSWASFTANSPIFCSPRSLEYFCRINSGGWSPVAVSTGWAGVLEGGWERLVKVDSKCWAGPGVVAVCWAEAVEGSSIRLAGVVTMWAEAVEGGSKRLAGAVTVCWADEVVELGRLKEASRGSHCLLGWSSGGQLEASCRSFCVFLWFQLVKTRQNAS